MRPPAPKQVGGTAILRRIPAAQIKGREEPFAIHEVLDAVRRTKLIETNSIGTFGEATQKLEASDLDGAANQVRSFCDVYSSDQVAAYLKRRIAVDWFAVNSSVFGFLGGGAKPIT